MNIARSFTRPRLDQQANNFLSCFPHRYDYIWSEHPDTGDRPQWQTESRHPLSDRLIQQGAYLYGVRFGAQTQYCLLDIDIGSPYHPRQDPLAVSRIVSALEPLGLFRYLACISSYSGGLHLYFPFEQHQSSWKLAIAVSTLLTNAGFKLRPGHLEAFPDPKPFSVVGKPSLFNAHRLPLQTGSYLLNEAFEPIWGTQQHFVQQWHQVQIHNEVDERTLRRLLKQLKRERYQVSTKAEKFINDLNAEIELGWTGQGQTNYLLGRITMREYIFRHVLSGSKPLEGAALVDAIVDVAKSLPGYFEYCRHRHEIRHRAEEWARCIENSHYFHYGDAAGRFKAKLTDPSPEDDRLDSAIQHAPSWNQQQLASARDRIRHAIATLLEQGTLPANPTARFHTLVSFGIGGGTLYRHRDLWHPHYFQPEAVENPPHPPTTFMNGAGDCLKTASPVAHLPSLFSPVGRNPFAAGDCSDYQLWYNSPGGNNGAIAPTGCRNDQTQIHLGAVQAAQRTAYQLAYQQQQARQQAAEARQINRMRQYLESGDPILMAEAIAWNRVNPGCLDELSSRHVSSFNSG